MQSDGSVFQKKPVFDYNHVPLGHVTGTTRDPKTRDTRQIILALSPEAQQQLGTKEGTLSLPASMVFGMRRDEVTLDRPIHALRQDPFPSRLKK